MHFISIEFRKLFFPNEKRTFIYVQFYLVKPLIFTDFTHSHMCMGKVGYYCHHCHYFMFCST